jgi:diguanylate cyclase (GGDEF)-like protein
MKNKPVILIVDDVPSNIQMLAGILKEEYKIKVAINGERALELSVLDPLPDLILLDVEMPQMNGYDVLKKLKEEEKTKNIPVIFVTGNDTIYDEEKGLLAGAVDYITKPVRPAIVKARINTHITLKSQRDELMYIALHDKLTGLYNRHYLTEIGDLKFARAKRHNEDLSVIMSDVDHFKAVNDTYGHLAGDKVLQAMGALLNKTKRAEDLTARYGGEEFVIVLEHCNANSAKDKADEIRVELLKMNIDGICVTASFGVAQLNKEHKNFEDLLKDADTALYKAKESGRNRVVVYNN